MTPEEIGRRLLGQLDQIRAQKSDIQLAGTWPTDAKLSDVTDWAVANGLVDLSAGRGTSGENGVLRSSEREKEYSEHGRRYTEQNGSED